MGGFTARWVIIVALAGAGFGLGNLLAPNHRVTDSSTTVKTVAVAAGVRAPRAAASAPALARSPKKPGTDLTFHPTTNTQPLITTRVQPVRQATTPTQSTNTQATKTQPTKKTTELQPPDLQGH